MDRKLLVVGWDAATQSHLNAFDLDFYDSLSHGGTLLPEPFWQSREVDSGTAWTTLTTGLSMREHEVVTLSGMLENEVLFDAFSKVDRLIPRNVFGLPARIWARKLTLDRQPTNEEIPYKRVWHYVPNSLGFGVPLTYPAKPTDGVTVSGFPSPEVSVEPSELTEAVRERYSGEPRDKFDEDGYLRDDYVEDLFEMHREKKETVQWLEKERDFNFSFVTFTLLDRLLHVVEPDDGRIRKAYETIDETTRQLVDESGCDDVLILSDHGMKYDPRWRWEHIHDETSGIWAGTSDFGLDTHMDVTPAILDYYEVTMDDPTYRVRETVTDTDQMTEQLQDLGYL